MVCEPELGFQANDFQLEKVDLAGFTQVQSKTDLGNSRLTHVTVLTRCDKLFIIYISSRVKVKCKFFSEVSIITFVLIQKCIFFKLIKFVNRSSIS